MDTKKLFPMELEWIIKNKINLLIHSHSNSFFNPIGIWISISVVGFGFQLFLKQKRLFLFHKKIKLF